MKSVIIAYVIVILIIALVILNSLFVSYNISEVMRQLEKASDKDAGEVGGLLEEYTAIYDDYLRRQKFLSITVNHDDLTNVEDGFEEILGALRAEDYGSVIITKSRLIGALSHLRRLSGINIDSIL